MFLGIGQISGPLYGSFMVKHYNFRICCDVLGIICLVFSIIYYFGGKGREALKNSKWINVPPEDTELVLNRSNIPMAGMCSPASNPNSIR